MPDYDGETGQAVLPYNKFLFFLLSDGFTRQVVSGVAIH